MLFKAKKNLGFTNFEIQKANKKGGKKKTIKAV